ncbi:ClC family H(+)/Cl(-) exchange transporter [Bifidobacterium xylocopae]|uniref:Sodium:proton antiporter n=1 Tax=Bifidobacterium xylocopae TaxID=2493119 RepID=A0A366KDW7_9BIFI|nr:sodium:proton antiporter [Bifidobacterium xylocopae]
MALKAVLCGLVAGILVVLYRKGVSYGTAFARCAYSLILQRPLLALPWVAAAVAVGLFVAWLIKLVPMASGSGIPQVEGVVLWGLRMRALPVLAVRYTGGFLCALFGMSLGREGPSIQIGAAGSQVASRGMRQGNDAENYLVTAGAAAGLSAAFNAPLSGMVFALEEIHRSFSPVILLSAAAASLSADFVSKNWFGLRPVLDFTAMPMLSVPEYLLMIPLGLIAGLVGSACNRLLLGAQDAYGVLPAWSRTVVAFLIALPVGIFLPAVLGGGEDLIGLAERTHEVSPSVASNLLLLLVVKMMFTAVCFGSGAPGGIFMPILAVGTLTGGLCGVGAVALGMPVRMISVFAVCAMAGALTASVKAPVTSILLTVEMSGSLVHMLPVALCAFTALLVSDLLKVRPIYEALLERSMRRRRQGQKEGAPPSALGVVTMEFVVEYGSRVAGRRIGQVDWPGDAVVVGLRRGDEDMVPTPERRLLAGDYIYLLFDGRRLPHIRNAMADMCR